MNAPSRFPAGSAKPRSIRSLLLSLVLLVLLPLMLMFLWLAVELAAMQRSMIEQHRADITRRVSVRADREVALYFGMLRSLTASPDIHSGNVADFARHAAGLENLPEIKRVWKFSAAVADGADVEPEPGFYRRVLNGESVISTVRGTGADATFSVGVPVLVDARPQQGVAMEVNAGYLGRLLFDDGVLEAEWVAAIVDRTNKFVARSLDNDRRVGTVARPELGIAANAQDPEGTFENVTYEGAVMENSYYRSPHYGWTTVVAVPRQLLAAPLRQSIMLVVFAGVGILLLTLVLASLHARQISEPVRSLSRAALAMNSGGPIEQPRHRVIELDDVRSTLERTMASSAHLSALVATSGDAIMSVAPDGAILTWNAAAERLLGYKADEIIGKSKKMLVPGNRSDEFEKERNAVMAGEALRFETVRRRRDGSLVDVSINSSPIKGPDGSITAMSSIIHDISDRKASEAHIHMLMRELAHRSKNQIAVIQAIAGQTSRTASSREDFAKRFGDRLRGLATSYDLLTAQDWKGVKLIDLVSHQLDLFTDSRSTQIAIEGDDTVQINSTYAEAIGLALHELATNAVKYGAWSVPTGKVTVSWTVERSEEGATLTLIWSERGGPAVEPPSRKGFGTTITERMVGRSVNGAATIEYAPEGVTWRLECPLPPLLS